MGHLIKDISVWAVASETEIENYEAEAVKTGFFNNDGQSHKSINFWVYLGNWNGEVLWRHIETNELLLQAQPVPNLLHRRQSFAEVQPYKF